MKGGGGGDRDIKKNCPCHGNYVIIPVLILSRL